MMSPMNTDISLIIDEHWLNFECEESMLALVSPNEICPIAVPQLQAQHITHDMPQTQQQVYQIEQESALIERQFHQHQTQYEEKFPHQFQSEHQLQHEHSVIDSKYQSTYDSQFEQHVDPLEIKHQSEYESQANPIQLDPLNQIVSVGDTENIGHPPLLVPRQEKVYSIQQQLDYRKALVKQRCERLKARLDGEPLNFPPRAMKKSSGKKMTGRERLSELERQERALLAQRDHLKETIAQFETKCAKLRELLGNIVSNSPEYNDEMINCLRADGLLIDSHVN